MSDYGHLDRLPSKSSFDAAFGFLQVMRVTSAHFALQGATAACSSTATFKAESLDRFCSLSLSIPVI